MDLIKVRLYFIFIRYLDYSGFSVSISKFQNTGYKLINEFLVVGLQFFNIRHDIALGVEVKFTITK